MRVLKIGLVLFILMAALGGRPSEAVPIDWSQPVFGIVEGFYRSGEASAMGARWDRVTVNWYEYQPNSSEEFQLGGFSDQMVGVALNGGRQVVGLVKSAPPWASESGQLGAVPRGLDLPYNDPNNLWGAFVTKLVTYYASVGVHHWIVWNEPNILSGEGTPEFLGNVNDYAQLLKVFYQAARAVDPTAHVQVAGLSWFHDAQGGRSPYLERLLVVLAQDAEARDNSYFFDGITLHIYFTTQTVWDITTAHQDMLNRHGLGHKQLWLAEFNASPRRDPVAPINARFMLSLEQQADFIVQASALALAAGVDRLAVFRMFDNDFVAGSSEAWGLIRADDSARPAYHAYQQVIQKFSGALDVTRYRTPAATAVVLTFPDHTLYVMWSNTFAAGEFLIENGGEMVEVFDAAGTPILGNLEGTSLLIDAPSAEQVDLSTVVVQGPVRIVQLAGGPRPVIYRPVGGQGIVLN